MMTVSVKTLWIFWVKKTTKKKGEIKQIYKYIYRISIFFLLLCDKSFNQYNMQTYCNNNNNIIILSLYLYLLHLCCTGTHSRREILIILPCGNFSCTCILHVYMYTDMLCIIYYDYMNFDCISPQIVSKKFWFTTICIFDFWFWLYIIPIYVNFDE